MIIEKFNTSDNIFIPMCFSLHRYSPGGRLRAINCACSDSKRVVAGTRTVPANSSLSSPNDYPFSSVLTLCTGCPKKRLETCCPLPHFSGCFKEVLHQAMKEQLAKIFA